MSLNGDFRENIRLNQQEIEGRRTMLSSLPRKLNVALTTRCNISCRMCETKNTNWQVPERTVNEIVSLFPCLERIIWQGGEVFLFDSFREILRESSRWTHLTHEITTNSHLIDQGWLEIIRSINLDLNISVDGFRRESYEFIRQGSSFQNLVRVLEQIRTIKKERPGKTTVLIFTVMKSNLEELPRSIDFAKTFDFNRVIVQPIKGNHGSPENIFYNKDADALEYLSRVIPELRGRARANNIELVECLPNMSAPHQDDLKARALEAVTDNSGNGLFCYAPWQQMFIEWGGKVYPHCLCLCDGPNKEREIGSVLEQSLPDIWNSQAMQAFRRKIIDNDAKAVCSRDCLNGSILPGLRNLGLIPDNAGLPDNKNPESNPDAALMLAKTYKGKGNHEMAFQELKPLLAHPDLGPEAQKELGDIYPAYIQQIKAYNFHGEYAKVIEKLTDLVKYVPEADAFSRNKINSELEIAQRKLIVESQPRNLIVTLSTRCNLNCVMCEERRIDWEIPKKTLEEITRFLPYLERIVWQGGEAFIYPEFGRLLDEASRFAGLRQVITTNGLLINEEWAEKLVKNNIDLTFSIDGITKEVYERIRRGAKFETLMHNLINFNKARKRHNSPSINTNLHTVIMRSNYRQLEQFIDFAREYEFRVLALLFIGGNFDNPENIFHLNDTEALSFIRETIPKVEEKARRYGIILENRLPAWKYAAKEPKAAHEAPENAGTACAGRLLCHLPWLQMFIDYDGSIRPDCVCRPEKSIGSVMKDSLAAVWNNEKMQDYRRLLLAGRCEEICNFECTRGQVSERYLKFS